MLPGGLPLPVSGPATNLNDQVGGIADSLSYYWPTGTPTLLTQRAVSSQETSPYYVLGGKTSVQLPRCHAKLSGLLHDQGLRRYGKKIS